MNTIKTQFLKLLLTSVVVYIPVVNAQGASCPNNVGKDFQSSEFSVSGLNAQALIQLNDAIDTAGYDVRSLLVLHKCQLIFERYKQGITRDQTHALYSVSKQLTMVAVAAALKQGKIVSLDESLGKLISRPLMMPDADWAKLEKITLRNVLTLKSGIDTVNGKPALDPSTDMLREGLRLPFAATPGEKFNYADYDFTLAGLALSDTQKMDLPKSINALLLQALQVPRFDWEFQDKVGRHSGGVGAKMRPMDMLKIGQLMLERGQWNGTLLIEPTLVDEMMAINQPVDRGYFGLGWWIGKNSDLGDVRFAFANGRKAQRIYVFPAWQLVVVLTSALTPDDERVLPSIVVKHLGEMMKPPTTTSNSPRSLIDIQAKGFNGNKSFAHKHDEVR